MVVKARVRGGSARYRACAWCQTNRSANTFKNATDSTTADIRIFEGVNNLTIDHNILKDGAGRAYRASNFGTGASDPTGVHLNRNSITGYTGAASTVENAILPVPQLDAECNWWESATGPGAPASTASTNVDSNPWLTTSNLDGQCGFTFNGFFQPVDNLPTLNVVKAGRAIPVKFSLGGYFGLNIFAAGYPTSNVAPCNAAADDDVIELTVNAGTSSLSYDASTDTYTYVWKTDKLWANSCRQLRVKLTDGSVHAANFSFKK